MLRTALRNVAAHKLRLLTTGLAVVLGVAFMTGTLVLTATINRTMNDMFSNAYAGTDAVVRAKASFESQGYAQRGRIDQSLVDVVGSVDGVAHAEGEIWGFAQVIGKDGEPVGNPSFGPPTIGTNWTEGELNTWTLVDGRGPRTDDEVVIDKRTADEGGYVAGDRATVMANGKPVPVTIAGVARFGGSDSPAGASFTMFTFAAAQAHLGEPSRVDDVAVVAKQGVSQEDLVARIGGALPKADEVITGKAYIAENQDSMAKAMSMFDQFLIVFAVIALLVGGFIIFNTFFITVVQRTREHALMRAVGASRRQVLAAVLLEALAVGVVASAVGLVAGVGVAAGLKAMLAAFKVDLPAGGIVFTPGTAVFSFGAGVLITVVSALSPARKAGKVPPVAAMRDIEVTSGGYGSKERVIVGLLLLVGGVSTLLYGLLGSPGNALAVVGIGAVLTFFAVSVLGRTVSLPMSRVIGLPLPFLRGIAGHLARQNAMRSPKRTAASAAALMIGVGLVSFITIFAASTKTSFGRTVDRAFSGDLIITAPMGFGGTGGVSPDLAKRLNDLPEVQTAAGIRAGIAEVDGSVQQLLAADDATFELFDVKPVAGSPRALGPSSIAVYEDTAREHGLRLGDKVDATFTKTGDRKLTVDLIYGENQPAGNWLLGVKAYEANFPTQQDAQVFIKNAPGVEPGRALAAVKRVAADYPGTKVLDQSEYKQEQLKMVDQMLGLVYALLALAIVIALLGIGNTLALSIFERTRELGVLRAVGMTRRQLRSTIRWESVIIALQGAALGLLIGVFFGWALVTAMRDQGLNTFSVPVSSLAMVVVLAALAGVVAAVLPARRAARLDVLRAVVSE